MILLLGKHLVRAVLALLLASVFVFFLQWLAPPSPPVITDTRPQTVEDLRRQLGSARPESYADWLGRTLGGELGESLFFKKPVAELIGTAVPVSLQLMLMAIVLGGVAGVALGVLSMVLPRAATHGFVAVLSSLPHFILGVMMVLLVVAGVIQLPVSGYVPFTQDWQASLDRTIMPALALAWMLAAVLMRQIHEATRPVAGARPGGMAAGIAQGALEVVGVLSGLAIMEAIFAVPGLGRLLVSAALALDYPVLMPLVLLAVTVGIAVVALADIVRALAGRGLPGGSLGTPRRGGAGPTPRRGGAGPTWPAPPGDAAKRGLAAGSVRNGFMIAGLVLAALFLVLAVAGPFIAPHDPMSLSLTNRLKPPGGGHPFGTDGLGRDVLSRVLHGAGPALIAGLAPVAIAFVIGVPLGLLAGYAGRHPAGSVLDVLIMGFMDAMHAFPVLALTIVLAVVFGAGAVTTLAALAIAATPVVARLARDHAAGDVHSQDQPLAGRLAALAMTLVAMAIMTDAAVAFLGFGAPPPAPSWGGDAGNGLQFALQASWLMTGPAVAIVLAALSFNLIAAGLRHALDGMAADARHFGRPRA